MHSLKFRIWGLYGDEYTYIDKENRAEAESVWDKGCIAILDEKHIIECGTDEDGEYWYVEGVKAIEQYTGLKDKNGKEIYEGDIVRYSRNLNCNTPPESRTVAVSWWSGEEEYYPCCTTSGFALPFSEDGYEVIGNIHENPELLEDKG